MAHPQTTNSLAQIDSPSTAVSQSLSWPTVTSSSGTLHDSEKQPPLIQGRSVADRTPSRFRTLIRNVLHPHDLEISHSQRENALESGLPIPEGVAAEDTSAFNEVQAPQTITRSCRGSPEISKGVRIC